MKRKAIKPMDVDKRYLSVKHHDELLDYINLQISQKMFQYTSGWRNDYFKVNIYYYMYVGIDVINDVVMSMKDAGWDAWHGDDYCGHGPFYSIRFRTDEFNPTNIKDFNSVK